MLRSCGWSSGASGAVCHQAIDVRLTAYSPTLTLSEPIVYETNKTKQANVVFVGTFFI